MKQQATLMITICANGEPHCKPFFIFNGQGLKAPIMVEKSFYDSCGTVEFNPKGYSNERATLAQIQRDFQTATEDPNNNNLHFLVLEVFSDQKTPTVL